MQSKILLMYEKKTRLTYEFSCRSPSGIVKELYPKTVPIRPSLVSAQLPFLHLLLVVASYLRLLFWRRCHTQDYSEHEEEDVAYAQYEKYDCERLHFNSCFSASKYKYSFRNTQVFFAKNSCSPKTYQSAKGLYGNGEITTPTRGSWRGSQQLTEAAQDCMLSL